MYKKNNMYKNRRNMMDMHKDMRYEMNPEKMEHLIERIYLSIEEELRAAAYYRALAEIAPNQFAEEMILGFAKDEREHAYQLQQAYEKLTGEEYDYCIEEYEFELEAVDYEEYLEKRILEETADYKKYKDYYLMTNNPYLRDIFFNLMHDENYHAVREFYLLHMSRVGMMHV
jgi:rubrerythrin